MLQPRALYIHVPFCASTCPYCDFNSVTVYDQVDEYVEALCAELCAAAATAGELRSVYIGGGTPSFLDADRMSAVLATVRGAYALAPDVEWTIEANPGSTTTEKALAWRDGGVNRVSVGAQSFDAGVLRTLGRRHTPTAIERAVREVQAAGIANISVDLMYGVPGQSVAAVHDSAAAAIALDVVHVSAYHLTIEANTPFGIAHQAKQLAIADDEMVLQQRGALEAALASAGLARYEISNYARPGYESRHNMAYWEYEPYLGCGAGAVGFDGRTRTRNLASVKRYIAAVQATGSGAGSREHLDYDTLMFERIFSGFRLNRGLDGVQLAQASGYDLSELFPDEVRALQDAGLIERAQTRWRLTDRGLPVANEIALRFLR